MTSLDDSHYFLDSAGARGAAYRHTTPSFEQATPAILFLTGRRHSLLAQKRGEVAGTRLRRQLSTWALIINRVGDLGLGGDL